MSVLNKLLSECIRDADKLALTIGLNDSDAGWIRTVSEKYPICIPPYYLNLIDLSDPDDPIRKICIPGLQELSETGHEDTSGESSNTVARGMQHKYRQTALILTTNQCSMYCRFCFRKRMVGSTQDEIASHIPDMVHYVREHPEINNVLLSGGDALININRHIGFFRDSRP